MIPYTYNRMGIDFFIDASTSTSDSSNSSGDISTSTSDSGSVTPPPGPGENQMVYGTQVTFYQTGNISGTVTDGQGHTDSYNTAVDVNCYAEIKYYDHSGNISISGVDFPTLQIYVIVAGATIKITDYVVSVTISDYEMTVEITWQASGTTQNGYGHSITYSGSGIAVGVVDVPFDVTYP